jgi:hypothetical protein
MHATDEIWKALCEEASTEQDPERLLELVQEINHLLESKRMRFSAQKPDNQLSHK